MKPKLFLLSFTDLKLDGQVLRQIQALAPHFDVTAAGLGENPSALLPGVSFRFLKLTRQRGLLGKALRMASYLPGYLFPPADFWPWAMTSEYKQAREALLSESYDLVFCNELNTMLLGVEVLKARGIPFVVEYREYPPQEAPERFSHRFLKGPHAHRCLKRFGRLASGNVTVNESFVQSFKADYGFCSIVVLNAPALSPLEPRPKSADGKIHLIYHGLAAPNRNIELIIRAMPLLRPEFVLHLMVITTPAYMEHIKREVSLHAPDRVYFEEPVTPGEIASRISEYDVGLIVAKNHSYNNREALPNKLFEYIHGGLALCCSKTPACVQFIGSNHNGWLIDEVTSESLAACLNALTREEIDDRKTRSLAARELFHADKEMAKLVELMQAALPNFSKCTPEKQSAL